MQAADLQPYLPAKIYFGQHKTIGQEMPTTAILKKSADTQAYKMVTLV
jgi:hypothetical protein